ncbi:hypothetical protein E4P41_00195 [Geodermatophilus sp. DF01-2]|uniref:hypothetical protein n=1 Tax=Geodermatophilus sp. DF01-2 TaxID=2559610 RepID=UPI00107446BD|nr:hypothetical protein [Geodermatophilus sp. DF01_2]TFV64704.1 hypothetical protein E4P41_00195 [Geodermatophilus sp. DF01_2]
MAGGFLAATAVLVPVALRARIGLLDELLGQLDRRDPGAGRAPAGPAVALPTPPPPPLHPELIMALLSVTRDDPP